MLRGPGFHARALTKVPQLGQGQTGSSPQKSRLLSRGKGVNDGRWNLPVGKSGLTPNTTWPRKPVHPSSRPTRKREARDVRKREFSEEVNNFLLDEEERGCSHEKWRCLQGGDASSSSQPFPELCGHRAWRHHRPRRAVGGEGRSQENPHIHFTQETETLRAFVNCPR